ncbi:DUF4397 domain-containing protein [Mucilaginibacter sp. KACC 22063]|uniref:DUF4397 domain-containing protein n=1 Tax=Mucilaginibacter sp. KACC 22063 TaxID=3025666 RepID=UPI002365B8FA|nr:DUF4397 domain-containing protein [Mucilaginibacter sp. KACC 22063]WDF55232.1 DUF4397 domain-containing protein [Mucilaginibacter sp. KACC 22063]
MKKISPFIFALLLSAAVGCKKDTPTQEGDPANGALVKFLHTAPGTPAIDGYINTTKITPQASVSVTDNALVTSITTGITYNYLGSVTSYLGQFPGNNYAVVPAGNTTIKVVASTPAPALISQQTSTPGAIIGSVTQNTTSGTAYSVFTMGLPGSTTTPLSVKVVEDKFPAAASGKAYIRFAHMIPNGAPVDVTGTYTPTGGAATTSPLVTGTAYGTVTDFVAVPVNAVSTSSYTFQMYLAGTQTKLGAVSGTVTVAPGRYYTIIGRGLAANYVVPGINVTLRSTARPSLPVTDPTTKLPEIYFNPPGIVFYTNK